MGHHIVFLYYSLQVFFLYQRQLKIFLSSLSDCKSPRVTRTFLSILADLNNAIVWTVVARPPISNSSIPISKPLRITVILIFHWILNPLVSSKYLSLFSFSLIFTLWSVRTAKSTTRQVLSLFLITLSYSGWD